MWPWRRHSPFESHHLPKKVFISHSYKDAKAREQLLTLLPPGVEPFVFPSSVVPFDQMVSDSVINAILGCDGLVWINGGFSSKSFWVAFERDYALRAHKQVFSFDPERATITPDRSLPLDLRIFPVWAQEDTSRVGEILELMRDRRYFVPWDLEKLERAASVDQRPSEEILDGFRGLLAAGGYGLMFLSWEAFDSVWLQTESTAMREILGGNTSAVVALLDRDMTGRRTTPSARRAAWLRTFMFEDVVIVPVYSDAERSETQRIDDLIVALYWLIYRNTRQNQFS